MGKDKDTLPSSLLPLGLGRKRPVKAFPASAGVPEASRDQGCDMPTARGKSLASQVWGNLQVLGHTPGGKGK